LNNQKYKEYARTRTSLDQNRVHQLIRKISGITCAVRVKHNNDLLSVKVSTSEFKNIPADHMKIKYYKGELKSKVDDEI
jgi:hypothetical protein